MVLTPGGIYQHRDGHLACAVGVAYPMPAPQFAALPLFAVLVMSGSDRRFEVRRHQEGFVFCHLYTKATVLSLKVSDALPSSFGAVSVASLPRHRQGGFVSEGKTYLAGEQKELIHHCFVAPPLAIYACCGDIWLRDLTEFLAEFERVSVGVAA